MILLIVQSEPVIIYQKNKTKNFVLRDKKHIIKK